MIQNCRPGVERSLRLDCRGLRTGGKAQILPTDPEIPWTEEPGRLQSMGLLELNTIERLHFHFSLSCIGEGNGNPLQCSCLENPRDREAWWAAVYAESDTTEAIQQQQQQHTGLLLPSF